MRDQTSTHQESICFNYGKLSVKTESIRCIESIYGNYTLVKFSNRKQLVSAYTLNHYCSLLETKPAFFNIRKGILINLKHMERIEKRGDGNYVLMDDGSAFRMSRRRGKALLAYLKE